MIDVLKDWCKGCNICIDRCPVDALEVSTEINKKGIYTPQLKEVNECTQCRLCELLCPDFAITVTRDEKEKEEKIKLIVGGVANEI